MTDPRDDTIFALASGSGPAAIAVVRLSGAGAGEALAALAGQPPPPARRAQRVALAGPAGEPLDSALAIWFPAPKSYTGEDMVELHLHGGRAVTAGVVAALAARAGLRPAEPGEFTRRAFENGKMDLTAAEGLADLVAAETAAQRRQALGQMGGALARLYEGWRARLLRALAHLEADIDFPDEDLPEGTAAAARPELAALITEIAAHLDDGRRGERLRDGLQVAIVGAPNVGKSSLLNHLARREAAIVSATAGTTRDVIEVHLDLAGYPATLADTAGLRPAEAGSDGIDPIEAEGVRRARARAAGADLRLAVFDATRWPDLDPETLGLLDEDRGGDRDDDVLPVLNKCDLLGPESGLVNGGVEVAGRPASVLSALTGAGVEALLGRLEAEFRGRWAETAAPALTRVRHRRALEECRAALERSLEAGSPELAAEDVRLAARALGRITGRVDVEEVLDVVFRDFCIGK